ncbi:twin-arginine translocation signal domain-containing protein [Halomarina ordinaria]|uniref:Twin-arginine translocation signal domain-containing protein n=1 Tax=Halomarina ordinaria TaxID=3033939 RepID=A0ABD5U8N3_9EURY|nr:twin-arginine translocation signal domain-containing protein [Halomarina sp. PSRA2]
MDRRTFLRATGGVSLAAGLAGCTSLDIITGGQRVPPVLDDRPDAVYLPTHREDMGMLGMGDAGSLKAMLSYSYPHRFWNVNGTEVEKTPLDGDAHLMVTLWDPDSGVVLPRADVSLEVRQGGSTVVGPEVLYPMLSQPMGIHYGDNFSLDGDGDYVARVQVGGLDVRRTGAFRERFAEATTVDVEFSYSQSRRDNLPYENFDDAGARRTIEPMSMPRQPSSAAPSPDALPGTVRGSASAGDVRFVVTTLDAPPAGIDEEGAYLAVSARTRHNRFVLPAMGLAARLTRDGERVFEGDLADALHPALDYHYGAVVSDVASGDTLTLSQTVPPQTARHEGYETAFFDLPEVEVTLQ